MLRLPSGDMLAYERIAPQQSSVSVLLCNGLKSLRSGCGMCVDDMCSCGQSTLLTNEDNMVPGPTPAVLTQAQGGTPAGPRFPPWL